MGNRRLLAAAIEKLDVKKTGSARWTYRQKDVGKQIGRHVVSTHQKDGEVHRDRKILRQQPIRIGPGHGPASGCAVTPAGCLHDERDTAETRAAGWGGGIIGIVFVEIEELVGTGCSSEDRIQRTRLIRFTLRLDSKVAIAIRRRVLRRRPGDGQGYVAHRQQAAGIAVGRNRRVAASAAIANGVDRQIRVRWLGHA